MQMEAVEEDVEKFIRQLYRKGVDLWAEEGTLRYRAPKGALGDEDRQTLRYAKRAIISHLERHSRASGRRTTVRRAPLSFTQLAHWRRELGGRPVRSVALATRLQGRLRLESLEEAVNETCRRHEALRTRIMIPDESSLWQEVCASPCAEMEVIRLSAIPQARRALEIERQTERLILEPDDYAVSPLFKAGLICTDESERILVLTLDHMISDFVSANILRDEILAAYRQLLEGRSISLPPVSVQFPDHCARLRAEPAAELERSRQRLDSVGRTRFPEEPQTRSRDLRTGWGVVRFRIDQSLRHALRAWAQAHGTTIVMAALAGYAALVMRWCATRETVIGFMIDGRVSEELERTIGYLAFPLHIRVKLEEGSTFIDILRQVIEDYCRAYDEADFGYASAQVPSPEYTRNTVFNWLPPGETGAGTSGSEEPLTCTPLEFSNPVFKLMESDHEPCVLFSEAEDGISGSLSYPRSRFNDRSMERFAINITEIMKSLLSTPTSRVLDVDVG